MQPIYVNPPTYPENAYSCPYPYSQNQEPPTAYPYQSQRYYQPYRENPQPQYPKNYPEDDIPDSNYENEITTDNNPPVESHIITPRISQDSVFKKNNYSYSTSIYCFDKIFFDLFNYFNHLHSIEYCNKLYLFIRKYTRLGRIITNSFRNNYFSEY